MCRVFNNCNSIKFLQIFRTLYGSTVTAHLLFRAVPKFSWHFNWTKLRCFLYFVTRHINIFDVRELRTSAIENLQELKIMHLPPLPMLHIRTYLRNTNIIKVASLPTFFFFFFLINISILLGFCCPLGLSLFYPVDPPKLISQMCVTEDCITQYAYASRLRLTAKWHEESTACTFILAVCCNDRRWRLGWRCLFACCEQIVKVALCVAMNAQNEHTWTSKSAHAIIRAIIENSIVKPDSSCQGLASYKGHNCSLLFDNYYIARGCTWMDAFWRSAAVGDTFHR